MTFASASHFIVDQLLPEYAAGEATSMASWIVESISGIESEGASLLAREKELSPDQIVKINIVVKRLLLHEPLQYILNESWFYGYKFYVDDRVLIPRPETEELVEWLINDYSSSPIPLKILDIGTGSGCIPIALKKNLHNSKVWSCDKSKSALAVAQQNAVSLAAMIELVEADFLVEAEWSKFPVVDIIISNPPYVPNADRASMHNNVIDFEPGIALFVEDNDPLIFYRKIGDFAKTHLDPSGVLYLEIHENCGVATCNLLESQGYTTELKKDMQGNDRMIKAKFD